MQDFLQKASASQLQAVRGHARTISTDKAVAKAREAERRMSESISRQQRLTGGAMSPIEMLPEGMLGDLGRPGSSGVFSDRASPFPDFHLYAHPPPPLPSDIPAGTINLQALNNNANPNPDAPSLPPSINVHTASLANLHYPKPTRTLNHHMPYGMFISDAEFNKQVRETSAQYPMGTNPASYNSTMRKLEAAATIDPILKDSMPMASMAATDVGIISNPPGAQTPTLVPHSRGGQPLLATAAEDDAKTQTINPSAIVADGPPPSNLGIDGSPLKETFGMGGGEMLPIMETDHFLT